MRLGIFAKTFARRDVGETLDAVKAHGLDCVQFNFSVAGLATLPERIEPELTDKIRWEAANRGIELAALSGTFNMIDPLTERREDGLRRLRVLAEACARIEAPIITLCSGTRDPHDMWRWHSTNTAPDAWRDLVASMRQAAAIAQDWGIVVAFEPEAANVIYSASRARRLLDELESPHVGVVFDPANLVPRDNVARMSEIVEEALVLLEDAIVVAHAKDIARDEATGFSPAGHGLLDFPEYVRLLRRSAFDGPLILHSLEEQHVDSCVALLRAQLASTLGARSGQ